MRGKVRDRGGESCFPGITPAYAGKSANRVSQDIGGRDHPRVCGEKRDRRSTKFVLLGSPPRMRGKDLWAQFDGSVAGITPAYAGKRPRLSMNLVIWRDHPRVCGEKPGPTPDRSANMGSPPRMRGKDLSAQQILVVTGITPAYAGKSE